MKTPFKSYSCFIINLNYTVVNETYQVTMKQKKTPHSCKGLWFSFHLEHNRGRSFRLIADKLDISRPTVKLCLKKYRESGVKTALEDSKGRDRRIEITDDAKAWVINIRIRPSGRIMVSFKPYPVHQFCRWAGRIFPHGDGI